MKGTEKTNNYASVSSSELEGEIDPQSVSVKRVYYQKIKCPIHWYEVRKRDKNTDYEKVSSENVKATKEKHCYKKVYTSSYKPARVMKETKKPHRYRPGTVALEEKVNVGGNQIMDSQSSSESDVEGTADYAPTMDEYLEAREKARKRLNNNDSINYVRQNKTYHRRRHWYGYPYREATEYRESNSVSVPQGENKRINNSDIEIPDNYN